ncbi:MAG: RNA polymerase sigma factor [Planctomycetota bacterium]
MSPAPIDTRSDQQLVEAINGGELQAFDVLYFRHRDWTLRLALRFTGHQDDALDVLQETFAYLSRKFPGFVLTAALTTFLYPAVRNFSLAVRRRRQRATGNDELLPLIPAPTDSAVSSSEQEREDWRSRFASLSEEHQEVLLMRFVDGLTLSEIAAALELPSGTVKSRLHYAIQHARQLYREE